MTLYTYFLIQMIIVTTTLSVVMRKEATPLDFSCACSLISVHSSAIQVLYSKDHSSGFILRMLFHICTFLRYTDTIRIIPPLYRYLKDHSSGFILRMLSHICTFLSYTGRLRIIPQIYRYIKDHSSAIQVH